jgi:hypothetical protein
MDLVEKKGETVSFSCIKSYAHNMPKCRILLLIFKKILHGQTPPPKLGGLFKFKSDLFNKNEVKTLNIKAISCVMSYLGLGNNFA